MGELGREKQYRREQPKSPVGSDIAYSKSVDMPSIDKLSWFKGYPKPDMIQVDSEYEREVLRDFTEKWVWYETDVLIEGSSYEPIRGRVALHRNYIKFLLKALFSIYHNYRGEENERGSILYSVHRSLVAAVKNVGIASDDSEELIQSYEDAALIIDIAITHEPFLENIYGKEIEQYLRLAAEVCGSEARPVKINKEYDLHRICQRQIANLNSHDPADKMLIKYFREYLQMYCATNEKENIAAHNTGIGSTPTAAFVRSHPELAAHSQIKDRSSSSSSRGESESKEVKQAETRSTTAKIFSLLRKVRELMPASGNDSVECGMSTPKQRTASDEMHAPIFVSTLILDKDKEAMFDGLRRRNVSPESRSEEDTVPLL